MINENSVRIHFFDLIYNECPFCFFEDNKPLIECRCYINNCPCKIFGNCKDCKIDLCEGCDSYVCEYCDSYVCEKCIFICDNLHEGCDSCISYRDGFCKICKLKK